MFITPKETAGDHKIKGGRKVETFVSRWLIANAWTAVNREQKGSSHDTVSASFVAMSSAMAVH